MIDAKALSSLEEKLGYHFINKDLIETALTHPSFGADHHVANYQRLEFLGDAVFELSVSHMLHDSFPALGEGPLTRMRAAMVREESLSQVARELGLGPMIRLSPGEKRAGGGDKPSILCDVCESVVAAVYLDGGFDEARALVLRLLKDKAPRPEEDVLDHKSRLQECLQRMGHSSPEYELTAHGGPDHAPVFTMCVKVDGKIVGEGSGHSKRAAQQQAARQALERMGKGLKE